MIRKLLVFYILYCFSFDVSAQTQAPLATAATKVTKTGFTANWTSVSGVSSYDLQVNTSTDFSATTVQTFKSISNTSFDVTGLLENTVYYYRVYPAGTAAYSNTKMTSTMLPPGSGNALTFDGFSYVNIKNPDAVTKLTNTYTIEAWINPTAWDSDPNHPTNNYQNGIVGNDGAVSNGNIYGFELRGGGLGTISFVILNSIGMPEISSKNEVAVDGSWTHVAVSVDNNMATLYINGVQDAQKDLGITPVSFNPNSPLWIGGTYDENNDGIPNRFFKGEIDEVRIWNEALSVEELRANMCKKLQGDEAGLITYFRLDESSGTITENKAAGSSEDGELKNAPKIGLSGALLGDVSAYTYSTAATANNSTNLDVFSVTFPSIASNQGVHVYKVNEAPNLTTVPAGLTSLETTSYYGVFRIGAPSYDVSYDYSTNDLLIAKEPNLVFATRSDNSSIPWARLLTSTVNTANHSLSATGQTLRSEYLIGVAQQVIPSISLCATINNDGGVSLNWSGITSGTTYTIVYGTDQTNLNLSFTDSAPITIPKDKFDQASTYYFAVKQASVANSEIVAATPVKGTSGKWLDFSNPDTGSDLNIKTEVEIPFSDDFNMGKNDFTVEAWYQYDKKSTLMGFNPVLVTFNDKVGQNGFTIGFYTPSELLWVHIAGGNYYPAIPTGVNPFDGLQHHYAISRRNSVIYTYIDGIESLTTIPSSHNLSYLDPSTSKIYTALTIGSGHFSDRLNFDGKIDEVRLWNVGLIKEQIKNQKDRLLQESEKTGLVANWHFDETSGDIAYDATCNGHNGKWLNKPVALESQAMFPYKPTGLKVTSSSKGQTLTAEDITTDVKEYHLIKYNSLNDKWLEDKFNPNPNFPLTASCSVEKYKIYAVDKNDQQGIESDEIAVQPFKGSVDEGLVMYFPFDNGDLTDYGPNQWNASIATGITAPAKTIDRKNGTGAIAFDGLNYLEVKNYKDVLNDKYSYSLWFQSNFDKTDRVLFSTGGSNDLDVIISLDSIKFEGHYNNFHIPKEADQAFKPASLHKDWNNLIVVYDGTKTIGYINGVEFGSFVSTGEIGSTGLKQFVFGGYMQSDLGRFTGSIDDFRLYNRVLNSEEIAILSESVVPDTLKTCNQIGEEYTITPTSISNATYNWSPIAGSANDLVFDPLAASDAKTYSVTVQNPAIGACVDFKDDVVFVVPVIDTGFVNTTTELMCKDDKLTLTAKLKSDSIKWFQKSTKGWAILPKEKSATLNVSDTGSFYFRNYSGHCYDSSRVVKVTFKKAGYSPVQKSGDTTFCDGSSVTLSVPAGASSYSWCYGNQEMLGTNNPSYTASLSGVYRAIATRGLGNCIDTSQFVHVKSILPLASSLKADKPEVCAGDTATLSVDALNGNSFKFNGTKDSYLINENVTFKEYKNIMSFEGWFKAPANSENTATLMSFRTKFGPIPYEIFKLSNPNKLEFLIVNGQAGASEVKSDIKLSDGQWHHIAITFKNHIVNIFENSVLKISQKITGEGFKLPEVTGSLVFGQAQPSNFSTLTDPFTGEMDEVRFWDIELDAATIANNYQLRLNGSEPGLIFLAHLNEPENSPIAKEQKGFDLEIKPDVEIIEGGGIAGTDPNFKYEWTKKGASASLGNTNKLKVTESGDYTINWGNSTCASTSKTETQKVNVIPFSPKITNVANTTLDSTICGLLTFTLNASKGDKYKWLKEGASETEATQDWAISKSGIYKVVIDSSIGSLKCSDTTMPVTITFQANPEKPVFSIDKEYCAKETLPSISVTNSKSNSTYISSINQVENPNQSTSLISVSSIDNTQAGTYSIGIQAIDGICKSEISLANLVINPIPEPAQIASLNPVSVCQDAVLEPVKLTLVSGVNYLMKNTSTGAFIKNQSGVFSASDLGLNTTIPSTTTFVGVLEQGGCEGKPSDSISIQVVPKALAPTIVKSANELCTGSGVELVASGGNVYQWYRQDENGILYKIVNATKASYNAVVPGEYKVVATDVQQLACPSDTASQQVNLSTNIYSKPSISQTKTGNVTLIQATTLPGKYQWFVESETPNEYRLIVGATSNSFTTQYSGRYMFKVIYKDYCAAFSNAELVNDASYLPASRMATMVGDTALYLPEIHWGIGTYPNPFNEKLHISLPNAIEGMSISLTDINGQLLFEKQSAASFEEIETSSFAAGMYLLKVLSGGKSEVFLVEKVK